MKRIIFLYLLFTFSFSQTGIITHDGFFGFGIWANSIIPFKGESEKYYNFKTELYIPAGIELSASAIKLEGQEMSYDAGIGYHYKFNNMGLQVKHTRREYNRSNSFTLSFDNDELYSEHIDLTFYKTGKLNPFIKFSNTNIIGDHINKKKRLDAVSIGGMGRLTRLITLSTSLMLPIYNDKFLIEHAWMEISFGFELATYIAEIFNR